MPLPVAQVEANAKDLLTICATTPDMGVLQPIATLALEICTAAQNLVGNKLYGTKLSGDVVNQTGFLINKIAQVPPSPEVCQALAIYQEKLDAIRRHFENMSVPPRKRAKFLSALKLKLETSRLRADLENHLRVIVAICDGKSTKKGALRSEDILEVVSLSTRVVGAISDVPVLHVMKPVVGVINLICETAKCVQSNREAALTLAARVSTVKRSIVDRAAMDGAAVPDPEALNALKLALEDIQSYLTVLKKPRRRFSSWILSNQERDRFARLDVALEKAVALFSATQALRTSGDVQADAHATAALVATVGRLDTTMTVMQADLGRLSIETPVHDKNNSFRSIFTPSNVQLTFFFFRSVQRYTSSSLGDDVDHQTD